MTPDKENARYKILEYGWAISKHWDQTRIDAVREDAMATIDTLLESRDWWAQRHAVDCERLVKERDAALAELKTCKAQLHERDPSTRTLRL